ncbi:Cytochrome C553 [Minicystis rosea]|nr:Cytochrome C553 [Minicystis rosea]
MPPVLTQGRPPARAILAIVVLASATSIAGAPAPLPGPAASGQGPHRLAGGPSDAASCASCHAEIAAEWRASAHGDAWRDPLFQKAYAVERLAFCRGCHAPESDPRREPTRAAADEGVGCATCHVVDGAIVSASTIATSPHATRVDTRRATASACAGCHQFLFPEASAQVVPILMQSTAREWAASSYASTSCNTCHMPRVRDAGGREHRSHRFLVRDPEVLSRAVRVVAERGESDVTLTLQSALVGHAVPTGDLFRRLVVRTFLVPDAHHEAPLERPVVLARRFLDVPIHRDRPIEMARQRVEVADTRLAPPGQPGSERRLRFAIPPEQRGAAVRWEVVYQRMSDDVASSFGIVQAADEIVIARGLVPARGSVSAGHAVKP